MTKVRVGALLVCVALLMAAACGKAQPSAAPTLAPTAAPAAQVATSAAPTQAAPPTAATAPAAVAMLAPTAIPTQRTAPTTTATATVAASTEQNDAGSGADAPDGMVNAVEIPLEKPLAGLLAEDDAEDWYTFAANSGAILQVAFGADKESAGLSLYLLDADRNELADLYRVPSGQEASLRYVLNTSGGGSYYLRVTGQGAYAFEVRAPLQNDTGAFGDAGDVLIDAVEFEADKVIEGLLGAMDEQDWYVVPLPHGAIIELAFTPEKTAEQLSLYLYNPDQEEIWSSYRVAGGTTKILRYLLDASSGGPYYLEIRGVAGAYAVDFKAAQQDDAGSGVDAPQDGDALGILPEGPLNGELGDADEEDWYYFDPGEGMTVHFTPAKGSKNLSIHLLDGNRDVIWEGYQVLAEKTVSYTLEDVTEGNYIIRIVGGSGAYTLELVDNPS